MTRYYDLVFVGNASLDEIHTFEGPVQTLFGGGVAFSAMAAVWTGKRIAVVTRLAENDDAKLAPLRAAGIEVHATYAPQTTRHVVHHLSPDLDKRQVALAASAGPPVPEELDPIAPRADRPNGRGCNVPSGRGAGDGPDARGGGEGPSGQGAIVGPAFLHLAALTDREASLDFLQEAAGRGFSVSVDLQGFVRQADRSTGEVLYREVPHKREIVCAVERVKLDALEAHFLTGLASPYEAAREMESWGARETMITWSDGVLVRAEGRIYSERFSNTSVEGRTGRGDTTFGSYLACRLDNGIAESLRWAAAVASMKLERPGLFAGTKDEIQARMDAVRR